MASKAATELLALAENLRLVNASNLNMSGLIQSIKNVLDKVEHVAVVSIFELHRTRKRSKNLL